MHPDGNSPSIIGDLRGAIVVQGYCNQIGMACQSFIDRIINDLIDHMVQTGAVICVANIHARPLTHSLQPFENLDGISIITGVFTTRFRCVFRLLCFV